MALRINSTVASGVLSALSVTTTSVDLVAPAGVMLEVTGLTDDMYQNAGFLWAFDDAAGDYARLPAGHPFKTNGKQTAIGPKAARVFDGNAGWTLYVYYGGESRTITGSVSVTSQASVYDDTNTFYLSPTSDFTNEAAGATNTHSSWSSLLSAVEAYGGDALICLNRGEDHGQPNPTDGQIRFDTTFSGQKITLRDYGVGTLPVVSGGQLWAYEPGTLKMVNIRLEGGHDSTTETGDSHKGVYASNTAPATVTRVLVHGCEADGLHINFQMTGDETYDSLFIYSDAHITNWQGYGVFGRAGKVGIVGCSIAQDVDALGGGDFANHDDVGNDHGPVRAECYGSLVMWACDLFSNCGWAMASGNPSHNPALRILSRSVAGSETSIAGCVMEGGSYVASLDSSAASSPANLPSLIRFTSNILLGTANTYYLMSYCYGGTSIDNNVLIMPDTGWEGNKLFHWLADFTAGSDASNFTKPIHVRNNTIVELGVDNLNENQHAVQEAALDTNIRGADPAFPGSTYSNNYVYAPNRSWSPVKAGDPINSSAIMTPRYKGLRSATDMHTGTLASDVPNGGTLDVPYNAGDNTWFEDNRDEIYIDPTDASGAFRSGSFSYGPTAVTITNTSGVTWPSGSSYRLPLTRTAAQTPALDTSYATPAGTLALWAPASGSSALGAATGDRAVLDFFGNVRGATTAKGAFDGVVA